LKIGILRKKGAQLEGQGKWIRYSIAGGKERLVFSNLGGKERLVFSNPKELAAAIEIE